MFHVAEKYRHACLTPITVQEPFAVYDTEPPELNNVPAQDLDTTVHECVAPAQHYVRPHTLVEPRAKHLRGADGRMRYGMKDSASS